jgi:hypothetical protein
LKGIDADARSPFQGRGRPPGRRTFDRRAEAKRAGRRVRAAHDQADRGPAVLLVNDQGVYLVSNGKPRDIIGADATGRKDAAKDEGRSFCAYAIGCHPEKDADWYARSGRRRRLRRDAAMGAQAEGADRRRREDHHAAHD